MGRGGNEKPGPPSLRLSHSLFLSFPAPPFSCGIENGATLYTRLGVYPRIYKNTHQPLKTLHAAITAAPPSSSASAAVFIFHLQFYFFISRGVGTWGGGGGGGAAEQIQLGSVIGPLAFSGVTERLKNSVAQT